MNNNIEKYNETTSVVLDIEVLQQKYQLLLSQYKQAVMDYISSLNDDDINMNKFQIIKGFAFNGSGALNTSTVKNADECSALCSNNNKCSGATYRGNQCLLRVGNSPLLNSTNDSYAIIRKSSNLLENIDKINSDLLDINNKILNKINNSSHLYYEQNDERINKTKELIQNYKNLMEEKEKLKLILNEYQTLDNKQNNNSLKLTQNYYYLYIYIFLAIILIIIITKYSFTKTIQKGGTLLYNYISK